MATILADNIFKHIFLKESDKIIFELHWNLFPGVQLTINQIGSGNDLAPNRWQAIIWTNDGPVHWCIYVALGGDELT